MAESEQISWAYVKLENIAEIFSAWIDSNTQFAVTKALDKVTKVEALADIHAPIFDPVFS